jgi:tripartite-type tricarboxylate transporter receptor subunit TctC
MKNLLLGAFALLISASAQAQDFPSKPVRLIVPFPPGGPLDVAGRLIGKELSDRWSQPVIIENRAGGTTGMDSLVRAPADGYNLMIISSTPLVTLPHMQKVNYDPVKDFVGISQTAVLTYVLLANNASGIGSVQQLIDEARKAPGKLNYGAGIGAGQHLNVELLRLAAGGIPMTFIPYKGAAPTMQGLLGNEVQVAMEVSSGALPLVNGGKVKALYVTGSKPLDQLKGVPTFESLFPGAGISSWHGIFAPIATPKAIQDRLAGDLRQVLAGAAITKRFTEFGIEPSGLSGEAFSQVVKQDFERWGEVIRKNNIKAE